MLQSFLRVLIFSFLSIFICESILAEELNGFEFTKIYEQSEIMPSWSRPVNFVSPPFIDNGSVYFWAGYVNRDKQEDNIFGIYKSGQDGLVEVLGPDNEAQIQTIKNIAVKNGIVVFVGGDKRLKSEGLYWLENGEIKLIADEETEYEGPRYKNPKNFGRLAFNGKSVVFEGGSSYNDGLFLYQDGIVQMLAGSSYVKKKKKEKRKYYQLSNWANPVFDGDRLFLLGKRRSRGGASIDDGELFIFEDGGFSKQDFAFGEKPFYSFEGLTVGSEGKIYFAGFYNIRPDVTIAGALYSFDGENVKKILDHTMNPWELAGTPLPAGYTGHGGLHGKVYSFYAFTGWHNLRTEVLEGQGVKANSTFVLMESLYEKPTGTGKAILHALLVGANAYEEVQARGNPTFYSTSTPSDNALVTNTVVYYGNLAADGERLAVLAVTASGQQGIFIYEKGQFQKVIDTNDYLFGRKVDKLFFSRDAFQDGTLAIWATLPDSTTAEPVEVVIKVEGLGKG